MANKKTVSIAMCVIDEFESAEYKKMNVELERKMKVVDTVTAQGKGKPTDPYHKKLETVLKASTAIVIVCTKPLKDYLEEKADSACPRPGNEPLLKREERKVLKDAFKKHSKKVILVTLSDEKKENIVPKCVEKEKDYGNPVDGRTQIDILTDKIQSKLALKR